MKRKNLYFSLVASAFLSVGLGAGAYWLDHYGQVLSVRAGIIRGSGDVYPAARAHFHLAPYRFDVLQNEVRSLNKVGPSPAPPRAEDKSFDPKMALKQEPADPEAVYRDFADANPMPDLNDSRFETCTYYEFLETNHCTSDYNAYREALQRWEQARERRYAQAKVALKAWEQQRQQFENARQQAYQKAYQAYRQRLAQWVHESEQHLDQVLAPRLKAHPLVHLATDLDGRGQTQVPSGEWFLSGGHATNFSLSYWQELPVTMTRKNQLMELANDSAEVENRNLSDDDTFETFATQFWGYTPPLSVTATPLDNLLADPEALKLQLSHGQWVSQTTYEDWTLLHMMAASAPVEHQAELVHLLLLHGADHTAVNAKGNTPLHEAVRFDGRAAAMLMLAYGADVNTANKAGESPLHLAVQRQSEVLVQLLLRHGADPQQVNLQGKTPLALAQGLKNAKLVAVLNPQATAQATASPTAKPTAKPTATPAVKPS